VKSKKLTAAQAAKVQKVLHEFKAGQLHAGSKRGPRVTDKRQAVAIALNQARQRK
jgi:hypothetical protein